MSRLYLTPMRLSLCGVLLLCCLVVLLTARLVAPSALQRFDQPKTVSYTADMVANGRWLMPRDQSGETATKPPLVNWLAAPLVKLGFWTEWAVKLPMVLGSLGTLALTVWMAHRLLRRVPEIEEANTARDAACLAGIAWLVNPANMGMIYHCRPDPVLAFFMTGAWALGTIIVCENEQAPRGAVLGFWLCVGLAALTKGPPALVPVLYLPLAGRLIGGRWSLASRSRWWWGFPLAMGMLLAWAVPCMIFYPGPFWDVLVGREMIAQALGLADQFGPHRAAIPSNGPIAALKLLHENPLWFVERFAPWSIATIGAMFTLDWRRWFRHPLSPAILWWLLVLVFFALSAHKTADYILPSYPAAAILAAYFCVTSLRRRLRIQPWHIAVAGFLVALGLAANALFFSTSADDRSSDHLEAFAKQALELVHDDPVVFSNTGNNTLQFFMHRHETDDPAPEHIDRARWIVMPQKPGIPAELVSEPMTTKREGKTLTLALYRAEAVRGRLEKK